MIEIRTRAGIAEPVRIKKSCHQGQVCLLVLLLFNEKLYCVRLQSGLKNLQPDFDTSLGHQTPHAKGICSLGVTI